MDKKIHTFIHSLNTKTYQHGMGALAVIPHITDPIEKAKEEEKYKNTQQVYIMAIYSLLSAGLITDSELHTILSTGIESIQPDNK